VSYGEEVPTRSEELLTIARRLATEAGEFLLDGLHRERIEVETKSSSSDMVSEMDRGAERLLVDGILAARPHDGILGEEGTNTQGTSGVRWVIDPLDGTTNYLYGQPQWSVSIGIEIDGVASVGVVDAPMLRETYTAALGSGAWCNERRLYVSPCDSLASALIATGFGYDASLRQWQGAIVSTLLPEIRDIRRAGSAALDLCFVASGRVDAYYERGCNAWDLCGGSVVIREAGGLATGLTDAEPSRHLAVAAGASLHPLLRARLRSLIGGEA
jgi:myo-inositol-1(or 4)-monophosphatase